MAFVSNCIIIDALMYGPRPAIIIEKLANAPPDKTFIKLRSCEELLVELDVNKFSSTCFNVCGSLRGTGMCAKIRNTTRIPSTAKIRLRISLLLSERKITFQFIINSYPLGYCLATVYTSKGLFNINNPYFSRFRLFFVFFGAWAGSLCYFYEATTSLLNCSNCTFRSTL